MSEDSYKASKKEKIQSKLSDRGRFFSAQIVESKYETRHKIKASYLVE
jgi:hypothetical protein